MSDPLATLAASMQLVASGGEVSDWRGLAGQASAVLGALARAREALPSVETPESTALPGSQQALVSLMAAQAIIADQEARLEETKRIAGQQITDALAEVFALWESLEPLLAAAKVGGQDHQRLWLLIEHARSALVESKQRMAPAADARLPEEPPSSDPVLWLELDPSAAILAQPPKYWHQLCSSSLHFSDPGSRAPNAVFPLYAGNPAEMRALAMQYQQVAQSTAARNIALSVQLERASHQ